MKSETPDILKLVKNPDPRLVDEISHLRMVIEEIKTTAFAAINPANWQLPFSHEDYTSHLHKTLSEIHDIDMTVETPSEAVFAALKDEIESLNEVIHTMEEEMISIREELEELERNQD